MSDLPRRLDNGAPLPFSKLNLGCGFSRMKGYVNVDLQKFHNPDIVGDIRDLPMLPSLSFDEVFAKAVIEHFEWRDTTRALYEWNRLLAPGGRLFVTTTYLTGLLRRLQNPEHNKVEQHKLLLVNLFSMQKYPGDYHYTAFTERLMRFYLWETGFEIESIAVRDGWLFDVWAVKALDYSFSALLASDVSDEEFVRTAYREILKREPSEQEVVSKINLLASGDSRPKAIKDFLRSEERAVKMAAASPNFTLKYDLV